jgi:hypothetical protein
MFNAKSDYEYKGTKTGKLSELYRQDRIYMYCLLSCHIYHCLSLSYCYV